MEFVTIIRVGIVITWKMKSKLYYYLFIRSFFTVQNQNLNYIIDFFG
jgi:hypothetical protein